jgi:hypothetical protein
MYECHKTVQIYILEFKELRLKFWVKIRANIQFTESKKKREAENR